jgi:hypothetical protein
MASRFGMIDRREPQLGELAVLPEIRRGGAVYFGRTQFEFNFNVEFRLFADAYTRFSPNGFKTLKAVVFSLEDNPPKEDNKKFEGMVGVTSAKYVKGDDGGVRLEQTITIYSKRLQGLTEQAVIGIIAHELAHVELNERYGPEFSKERESAADNLVRQRSRYLGAALIALTNQVETIDSTVT